MHIKVPFLAVFFISIFQIIVYGILSTESFDEVLAVDRDNVAEIQIIDFSDQVHHIKDPEQIRNILDYFNQFEYQRLSNDQTSYMPNNTMMISVYDEYQTDFIIPYGKEVLISHKVYRIKNGSIEQDVLLNLFNLNE